jgi:hypothetical protein
MPPMARNFFDPKLRSHHHVRIMSNRAASVANRIRVLDNTVRDLSQRDLRILLKTMCHPHPHLCLPSLVHGALSKRVLQPPPSDPQPLHYTCLVGVPHRPHSCHPGPLTHSPISLTLARLRQPEGGSPPLELPLSALISQRLPATWRGGVTGASPFKTLESRDCLRDCPGMSLHFLSFLAHSFDQATLFPQRRHPLDERLQHSITTSSMDLSSTSLRKTRRWRELARRLLVAEHLSEWVANHEDASSVYHALNCLQCIPSTTPLDTQCITS